MDFLETRNALLDLDQQLAQAIIRHEFFTITEGTVMTPGPAPYRRFDCGGRALCYVRVRPRKNAIRIDVSGLWLLPEFTRLNVPTASGGACLLLRESGDITCAANYLWGAIERTVQAEAAFAARNATRRPEWSEAA